LAGILAGGRLQLAGGAQTTPQQLRASEFQKLGQDLQAGSLSGAQAVFAVPTQNSAGASATNQPALGQAFNALGQALQPGKLTAAQQDFSTIQQDLRQAGQQRFHHHRHHGAGLLSELTAVGQSNNSAAQAFGSLAQALQSGNLSAAQQAYSAIQQGLQLFAAAPPSALSNVGSAANSSSIGSLSVTA
jgi:hypothetical protein